MAAGRAFQAAGPQTAKLRGQNPRIVTVTESIIPREQLAQRKDNFIRRPIVSTLMSDLDILQIVCLLCIFFFFHYLIPFPVNKDDCICKTFLFKVYRRFTLT